jgi:hypothetical protein
LFGEVIKLLGVLGLLVTEVLDHVEVEFSDGFEVGFVYFGRGVLVVDHVAIVVDEDEVAHEDGIVGFGFRFFDTTFSLIDNLNKYIIDISLAFCDKFKSLIVIDKDI